MVDGVPKSIMYRELEWDSRRDLTPTLNYQHIRFTKAYITFLPL